MAVVDFSSGNLASAQRGLSLAAARRGVAAEIRITADPAVVAQADRIVLPGQGAFADCAAGLAGVPGLRDALIGRVEAGAPYLGICVGMQLMAERGLEHGTTLGFGWIAGEIARMTPGGAERRLPHMGWNELFFEPAAHPLLEDLEPGDHAYFVHSYALAGGRDEEIVATTDYGGRIPAVVARGNVAGTQFHSEKSQEVGVTILGNFLAWQPARH